MSNLSVLDHNIMAGMDDDTAAAYLRFRDRHKPYDAERRAWLMAAVAPLIGMAFRVCWPVAQAGVRADLTTFFVERLHHMELA